jgi:hypothetical protein
MIFKSVIGGGSTGVETTVTLMVTVWVAPPPVPVTVMVEVAPTVAVAAAPIVRVDDPFPGEATEVGLKPAVR